MENDPDVPAPSRLPLASVGLLAALAASACYCDTCDPPETTVPVYVELEVNDDPATANYFGTLYPGDYFFIEGDITDSGADPFDGFAFTAGQPIHVDFQLFIDNTLADLDVCIYDPQIDQVVDCFQTASNPEQGGVDVFAGGLDFQLVVESFVGASTYGLEINVAGLPLAATAAPEAGDAPRIRSVPAGTPEPGRDPSRFEGYRRGSAETTARFEVETQVEIDRELGVVIETTTVERVRPGS